MFLVICIFMLSGHVYAALKDIRCPIFFFIDHKWNKSCWRAIMLLVTVRLEGW